jgi:malate dehydrogenase (oxaloacetate-decarboxylating)(NADP+)
VKRENITMVDTKGVIYEGRYEGMNPYKTRFARKSQLRKLAEVGCFEFLAFSGHNDES